jgi:hypothetical protein
MGDGDYLFGCCCGEFFSLYLIFYVLWGNFDVDGILVVVGWGDVGSFVVTATGWMSAGFGPSTISNGIRHIWR